MADKKLNVRVMQKTDTYDAFLASDLVYLENELLFAKRENNDIDIYLADGVHKFSELEPIFSSTWVFGRNEINLQAIQLLAADWENGVQKKAVSGVLIDENKQILLPAWAAQSKEEALSCGVDYMVSQNGELEFTCNETPTVDLVFYLGILGKMEDNEDDDGAYIKASIDTNFSSSSVNPLENRVITNRFETVEAQIRSITGGGSSGDPSDEDLSSLPAIANKLTNTTTYSATPTQIGTLKVTNDEGVVTEEKVDRVVIPFTLTVNKANTNPDTDISCFAIEHSEKISVDILSNAYWTGKASTGSFFGSCPIIIGADGSVNLLNVPITEAEYTLTGLVTVEYA